MPWIQRQGGTGSWEQGLEEDPQQPCQWTEVICSPYGLHNLLLASPGDPFPITMKPFKQNKQEPHTNTYQKRLSGAGGKHLFFAAVYEVQFEQFDSDFKKPQRSSSCPGPCTVCFPSQSGAQKLWNPQPLAVRPGASSGRHKHGLYFNSLYNSLKLNICCRNSAFASTWFSCK